MFMISFEFHTQHGNVQLTSYSLQEMSTLFREMRANQLCTVHSFSHVWDNNALTENRKFTNENKELKDVIKALTT